MTVDFTNLKVSVFPNINDSPVAPTASKAGNGSHLISLYNQLVEQVSVALNSVSIPQWQMQSGDYIANAGDKIIFIRDNYLTDSFSLTLPSSPEIGNAVSFILAQPEAVLNIFSSGGFMGQFNYTLTLSQTYQEVTLVWSGDLQGWISSNGNLITATSNPT